MSLKEIINIINDNTLGSKQMALKILEKIKDLPKEKAAEIIEYAANKHPTMAILKHINDQIRSGKTSPEDLINELKRMDVKIAHNLTKILDKNLRIVTYSRSQTLLNIFRTLYKNGYVKEIYLSESRPTMEGIKFAEELAETGIKTTLTIDIYLPELIKEADIVVIGCDAILPNKDIVNKIGSKPLAIAANYYKKPFIVTGDEFKYTNKDVLIKYGDPREIYSGEKNLIVVRNPYFEIVPHKLITYLVTNKEIIRP